MNVKNCGYSCSCCCWGWKRRKSVEGQRMKWWRWNWEKPQFTHWVTCLWNQPDGVYQSYFGLSSLFLHFFGWFSFFCPFIRPPGFCRRCKQKGFCWRQTLVLMFVIKFVLFKQKKYYNNQKTWKTLRWQQSIKRKNRLCRSKY